MLGTVAKVFAVIGGVIATLTVLGANGAPQEAAGSAMGLACAVIPYVIFKIDVCRKLLENQDAILAQLKSKKDK